MTKRFLFTLTTLFLFVLGANADEQGTHYKYNPDNYHARTVVYVTFVNANGDVVNDRRWKVGAFIGGECRYEATVEMAGNDMVYKLEVGGNTGQDGFGSSEMNQAITLRVFCPEVTPVAVLETGYEYLIEGTNLKFQGDYTYGEPTNPVKVLFDPMSDITLTDEGRATIHRNQPVDIMSFVENPEQKTVPSITWTLGRGAEDYLTLEGTTLTGKKITAEPQEVDWQCGNLSGALWVMVDAPATNFVWSNEYAVAPLQGSLTLAVGDNDKLTKVLTGGFTLVPEDATSEFPLWGWTSDNPDVIENMQGEFNVAAKGVAVLTGHASDDCGLQPTLKVKVEQPVTGIHMGISSIYAVVGSDITNLLNTVMTRATVSPEEADHKELAWKVDGTYVVLQNNRYIAQKLTENVPVNIYLEATDGYGYAPAGILEVNIIEPELQKLEAVRNPLGLMYAGEQVDVTDQLLNNIKVTPDSYTAKELFAQQKMWLNIVEDEQDMTAAPVHNVIDWEDGALVVKGAGTCSIQATAVVRAINDEGQLEYTEISTTFRVNVGAGLQEFTFETVTMTTEKTATITLHPNPADSEYDASKVKLELVSDNNPNQAGAAMPEGWKTLEMTKIGNDLQFSVKAYSLGAFTLRVVYNGEEMGRGSVNVLQRLHLKDGWQWIALQSQIREGLEEMFGDKLQEVRSATAMTYNDSKIGYWGDLRSLSNDETYKVKMNLGAEERVIDVDSYEYLNRMGAGNEAGAWNPRQWDMHAGWNWIGNPFQYWQNINDIFTKDSKFAEGDVVKFKTQFATYNGQQWQPAIYVEPGQGMIVYKATEGVVNYNSEYQMAQNTSKPATARQAQQKPALWTIDDSRFDDNMVMVAYVGAVTDPSDITLWAFVGDECRGQGVSVGDRQYITIHGQQGERVTFKVYDQVTGELRQVVGSRPFAAMSGTTKTPVALYAGPVLSSIDAVEQETGPATVYDLQGRQVDKMQKGLYIKNGRKVIVR